MGKGVETLRPYVNRAFFMAARKATSRHKYAEGAARSLRVLLKTADRLKLDANQTVILLGEFSDVMNDQDSHVDPFIDTAMAIALRRLGCSVSVPTKIASPDKIGSGKGQAESLQDAGVPKS